MQEKLENVHCLLTKGLVFTSEGKFASINQLVICTNKKHLIRSLQKEKKMINWLHGHFYRGFFSPKPQTLDFTTPENLKNHG